jgi:hypothetical protein
MRRVALLAAIALLCGCGGSDNGDAHVTQAECDRLVREIKQNRTVSEALVRACRELMEGSLHRLEREHR